MSKIRIKDIAEIANVSVGTVDRVIHNRGEVSSVTREKILKLLKDFDYKPDIAARSLALKREIHLAVVMPGMADDHTFWELPRLGVRKALEFLDHDHIQIHSYTFDQKRRDSFNGMVEEFPYERMEGVLFAPVFREESLDFLDRCEAQKTPVILFNSLLDVPSISSYVGQDAFQSGVVAARLIDYGLSGRKDLAIINMSARKDHYAHIIDREKGFRKYFTDKDPGNRQHSLDLNGADDTELKEKLEEICSSCDLGGLFVTNSRVHKVARFLAETGREQIRLIGYDLLPENVRYLKQGSIDFLLSQKPEQQAYLGLTSLYNLVVFNREVVDRQWLPIDIITRENLRYYQPKNIQQNGKHGT